MATAVRVRFPPSAPARHQGLWQLAATLSFFVVSSSEQAQSIPCFSCLYEFGSNRWYKRCLKCHPLPLLPLTRTDFPLQPNNPPFRSASSLCGPHLLFLLCSACCCQKTPGECQDTPEPGNMFPSGSQAACLPAFCPAACFVTWRTQSSYAAAYPCPASVFYAGKRGQRMRTISRPSFLSTLVAEG